jgi:flagellar hook protein FlgE
MSINSAINAAVSGLTANSSALSAISDNIANANTVGYKANTTEFLDLVGVASTAANYSAGGVQANTIQQISQNGTTQQTTSATDLSINGQGMFVVTSTSTPTPSDTRSYTQAGSFDVNAKGYLVNAAGYYLQGFPVNATTGAVTVNPSDLNSLQTINVADIGGTASATTTATVNANLNSAQAVSAAAAAASGGVSVVSTTTTTTGGVPTATFTASPVGISAAVAAAIGLPVISGNAATAGTGSGTTTLSVTSSTGAAASTTTTITATDLLNAYNYATNPTANPTPDTAGVTYSDGNYFYTPTSDAGFTAADGNYTVSITNTSVTTTPYSPLAAQPNASPAVPAASMASGAITPDATITIPISNSQGGQQTIQIDLLKTSTANQWYAEVVAPNGQIQYGANSTLNNNQLATGILTFNNDGTINLANSTLFGGSTTPTLDFGASGTTPAAASSGGTPLVPPATGLTGYAWGTGLGIGAQNISLNLATTPGGITQDDSATTTESISTDGTAFGQLDQVNIDNKGFVTATYSNGVTKQIAQVAIATFANPDGLTAVSGDAYQVSSTSGSFNLKTPGSAGAGTIAADSLETSTVDLSSQFADLITTQQAYSASAKVITTADTMEQALLQTIQ